MVCFLSLIQVSFAAEPFYIEYQQTSTGAHSSIPQIAEPANVEQSKNIDLDPYASSTRAVRTETSAHEDPMAKLDAKPPAEGMSATSGPLSHDLTGIYGSPVSSPTESKQQGLPKWEGLRPVEKDRDIAEGDGGGHDIGAPTERDAITQMQDNDKSTPTESAVEGSSAAEAKAEGEALPGELAD